MNKGLVQSNRLDSSYSRAKGDRYKRHLPFDLVHKKIPSSHKDEMYSRYHLILLITRIISLSRYLTIPVRLNGCKPAQPTRKIVRCAARECIRVMVFLVPLTRRLLSVGSAKTYLFQSLLLKFVFKSVCNYKSKDKLCQDEKMARHILKTASGKSPRRCKKSL